LYKKQSKVISCLGISNLIEEGEFLRVKSKIGYTPKPTFSGTFSKFN